MSDLRRILEENFAGHKSEISDYCKGHLNVSKIKHKKQLDWQQSVPRLLLTGNNRTDSVNKTSLSSRARLMTDDGTGSPGRTPRVTHVLNKDTEIVANDLGSHELLNRKRAALSHRETLADAGKHSLLSSRVFVEEYPAHALRRSMPGFDAVPREAITLPFTEAFSHKDRYRQMKRFNAAVVREQDALETQMMTGEKKVAPLEAELKRNLQQLQHEGHHGPNFNRLQVFSNSLSSVIEASPLFGQLLHEIKREYDSYLSYLLGKGSPQYPLLGEQLRQLLDKGICDDGSVNRAQDELEHRETEVRQWLEKRALLRDAYKEATAQRRKAVAAYEREKKRKAEVLSSLQLQAQTSKEVAQTQLKNASKSTTHAEEIDALNAQCWRYIDELKTLKAHLLQDCTPQVIIQQLEEHVHDREVDYQRLEDKENELRQQIHSMKKEFEQLLPQLSLSPQNKTLVLALMDVTDRDLDRELFSQGLSTEAEDEAKWNWYIF